MLTVKSDDVAGRRKSNEAIVRRRRTVSGGPVLRRKASTCWFKEIRPRWSVYIELTNAKSFVPGLVPGSFRDGTLPARGPRQTSGI